MSRMLVASRLAVQQILCSSTVIRSAIRPPSGGCGRFFSAGSGSSNLTRDDIDFLIDQPLLPGYGGVGVNEQDVVPDVVILRGLPRQRPRVLDLGCGAQRLAARNVARAVEIDLHAVDTDAGLGPRTRG